jgi:hypothetical protein
LCRPSNASIIPQYKQKFAAFKKKYEDMQYSSLTAGSTSSPPQHRRQDQTQQLEHISKDNVQRLEKSSSIFHGTENIISFDNFYSFFLYP